MGNKKLRLYSTDASNLISNLRGEVGEIIYTWVLMTNLMAQAQKLQILDSVEDLNNPHLSTLRILIDKLEDEIIARLSELAGQDFRQLNFYFALKKLGGIENEVSEFKEFITKNRFFEKRNNNISHKQLPEQWSGHKIILIPYLVIVKGIVKAMRIMKKIDVEFLGSSAKYLWQEMRKKRYQPVYPAKTRYMLMHYLSASPEIQMKIFQEKREKNKTSAEVG